MSYYIYCIYNTGTHEVYGIFYNKKINNFYLEHNESKMPQHKFEYNTSVRNIYAFEHSIQFVVSIVFVPFIHWFQKEFLHSHNHKHRKYQRKESLWYVAEHFTAREILVIPLFRLRICGWQNVCLGHKLLSLSGLDQDEFQWYTKFATIRCIPNKKHWYKK